MYLYICTVYMYVCTVHRADYNYSLGRSLVKQKPIAAGMRRFSELRSWRHIAMKRLDYSFQC